MNGPLNINVINQFNSGLLRCHVLYISLYIPELHRLQINPRYLVLGAEEPVFPGSRIYSLILTYLRLALLSRVYLRKVLWNFNILSMISDLDNNNRQKTNCIRWWQNSYKSYFQKAWKDYRLSFQCHDCFQEVLKHQWPQVFCS